MNSLAKKLEHSTARRIFRLGMWAALFTVTGTASAQTGDGPRGSRYVATTDWMTDIVSRLRVRGYLGSLSPLAQPWTRDEILRAVDGVPVSALDTMPRHVADWLQLLRRELAPPERRQSAAQQGEAAKSTEPLRIRAGDSLRLGAMTWVGATTATSPRIDPWFPLRKGQTPLNGKSRDDRDFWPDGGGEVWGQQGPFAADMRLGWDLTLRRADPDGHYPGRLFDVLPDNEMTYLSGRFSKGGFVVGRLQRNWAPVGREGLMLSDNAIGIPQIGYDLGGSRLVLRGMVGELDTLFGNQRWIVAHRLEYNMNDFAISIGEDKVYGAASPLISNLNPVEIFFVTGDKVAGENPSNTALDGQLWLRHGAWTLGGETFLDDVWITKHAPARGAIDGFVTVSATSWADIGIDYRAVLSYTYWTIHDNDRLMYYSRGLGDNFSDYDRWTLHADLYPTAGLRLTPTIGRQRKGEWDFRLPGISDSAWKASTTFLQGTPENINRAAIAGRYQRNPLAYVEWDAGMNFVSNSNHVRGQSLSEFSAMLKFGVFWKTPDR